MASNGVVTEVCVSFFLKNYNRCSALAVIVGKERSSSYKREKKIKKKRNRTMNTTSQKYKSRVKLYTMSR
jgi:hypothetical protein